MTYYDRSLIFFLPDSQPRWDLDLMFTPVRYLPEESRGIFKHCWSLFVLRGAVGGEPPLFLWKMLKYLETTRLLPFTLLRCAQNVLNNVRTKRVNMLFYVRSQACSLYLRFLSWPWQMMLQCRYDCCYICKAKWKQLSSVFLAVEEISRPLQSHSVSVCLPTAV